MPDDKSKYDKSILPKEMIASFSQDFDIKDKDARAVLKKKSERIATAIYKITDMYPTSEPLRLKLRRVSLSLLFTEGEMAQGLVERKKRDALSLLSFWNLSFFAGYISEANFNILKKELYFILWILEEENASSLFTDSYFAVDNLHSREAKTDTGRETFLWDFDDNFLKNIKSSPVLDGPREHKVETSTSLKDTGIREPKKTTVGKTVPKKIQRSEKKESILTPRKGAIVSFIKKEGEVGVKDIAKVIPGLSEKTIQRDLSDLVHSGVLEKVGDRRWSRYLLRRGPSFGR